MTYFKTFWKLTWHDQPCFINDNIATKHANIYVIQKGQTKPFKNLS
jgi:hypothetical protein